MQEKYNPQEIEKKWQEKWQESGIYKTKDLAQKPKFYALDFFPYPSGVGLHVGHPKGYVATDVASRMKMMQGFNLLHPMGWDAFGLPAENYAIKNKIHPRVATEKNVAVFKKQLENFGFTYDWDREINTTDPEFYKWTQWIFLKMFEKGLAYESDEPVNWCPSCKTVLANEDLEGGLCERCGTQVVQKKMKQWVLKMTAYADRLLYDLDSKGLDWEELIKEQQRNWIGRSEGATVKFEIKILNLNGNPKSSADAKAMADKQIPNLNQISNPNDKNLKQFIEVFTTRLDTIFGCTYCVVAPEHPLIKNYESRIMNYREVEKYVIQAQNKTNLERTELQKEKTGVELKGIKAINPFTDEEVPVWVADYVLGSYGTGAVMAVPAHDERDFEFARKYGLPIKQSVAPYKLDEKNPPRDGNENTVRRVVHIILENAKGEVLTLNLKSEEWGENKPKTLIIGGIEDGESPEDTAVREIKEETGYTDIEIIKVYPIEFHAEFFAAHKKVNRYVKTIGVVAKLKSEKKEEITKEEKDLHDIVWVKRDDLFVSVTIPDDNFLVKAYINNIDSYIDSGVLINSGKYDGLTSEKAREEMTKWLEEKKIGKKKVNYKMRDWVFSRQRYWGEPIPIIHCKKCGAVAVPEKDLPVKLPEVKSYEPTGTGESPLANIKEWVNVSCPKCGGAAKRETNTMPQWAGSSWYYLRFIDPKNSQELVDKEKEKYWMPVDLYVGGAEHATRHLLYARFWHKFLFDIGAVSTEEPFKKLFHVGLILAEDGRKMSKRWGNVINPDDVIREFGADSFRLYEMFMGPFSQSVSWSTKGVVGMRRFLERVWGIRLKVESEKLKVKDETETILIASNNEGKLKELKDHLKNFKILSLKDLKEKFEEPEETGKTFAENSLLKAKYYAEKTGFLTVADDSGLSINALGGEPGVFSSRYAEGDYKKAHEKILEKLKDSKDRSAYFQSVITLYNSKTGKYDQFEGKCEGRIADAPCGSGGFGYDPIFIPDGLDKTFGECSPEEKYKYDHRKKAIDKMTGFLGIKKGGEGDKKTEALIHKTIKKVTEDIENFKFNTAISALMILSNEFERQKNISKKHFEKFLILLSPFAPHIAEELWSSFAKSSNDKSKYEESIFNQSWPKYDPALVKEEKIELVIQVNGKVKDKIKAAADISESDAKNLVLASEKIKKAIENKEIRKVIFVKGRLINIVI